MAEYMPFSEWLRAGNGDALRAVAESVLQLLMEADVEQMISASRHKRSADRRNWRNGYRERILEMRIGSLSLKIPKLRRGSYFPPFLDDCRTTETVLLATIQDAWTSGVSAGRVEDLVQAMGLAHISHSQHAKLCKEIDLRVRAFLDWPSVLLEAAPRVPGTLHRHRH